MILIRDALYLAFHTFGDHAFAAFPGISYRMMTLLDMWNCEHEQ